MEKSKVPSTGSTWSHATVAITVLAPDVETLSQTSPMYCRSDELELCSSPPRQR